MRPPSSGRIGNRFNTISTTLIMIPARAIMLQALARQHLVAQSIGECPQQRHREVGPGPGGRDPQHVALRVAQIAEVDRHGLRPAEQESPAPASLANSSNPSGTSTVPTGSMCFSGFTVTRPSIHAVESPNNRAT